MRGKRKTATLSLLWSSGTTNIKQTAPTNSPACDVSQTKHPWMPQHVPVLPEITPLLTSYLSIFALVVMYREQNSSSRLNPTVNIPRNSLDGGCTEAEDPQENQEEQDSAWGAALVLPWEGHNCKDNFFLPPTQNFSVFQWVNKHPRIHKSTLLTAINIYLYRRSSTSEWSSKGPVGLFQAIY